MDAIPKRHLTPPKQKPLEGSLYNPDGRAVPFGANSDMLRLMIDVLTKDDEGRPLTKEGRMETVRFYDSELGKGEAKKCFSETVSALSRHRMKIEKGITTHETKTWRPFERGGGSEAGRNGDEVGEEPPQEGE